MKLFDLIKLGTEELIHMALSGKLTPSTMWTAIKGADRYRSAMAAGDIAGDNDAKARAEICSNCPSRVRHDIKAIDGTAGYCGSPFVVAMVGEKPTCGCLVTLTVGGEFSPAGKTLVASEECPQKLWAACPKAKTQEEEPPAEADPKAE